MKSFLDLTGLDIVGEPDEQDKRSLAEVEAFAASDRYIKSTQETTEKYHQLHEENVEAVSAYRWEYQEEFDDIEGRIGTILHENELVSRLNKLLLVSVNPRIRRGMRGLAAMKGGRMEYCCAMQAGYMPEYSLMNFDDHGLPTAEKYRGWRTVLLRLIMQEFIAEELAHGEFGFPTGPAGQRYRRVLWRYRNRRGNHG